MKSYFCELKNASHNKKKTCMVSASVLEKAKIVTGYPMDLRNKTSKIVSRYSLKTTVRKFHNSS